MLENCWRMRLAAISILKLPKGFEGSIFWIRPMTGLTDMPFA